MKKKRKKNSASNRIARQMKGLTVCWKDKVPWEETDHIVPGEVTHTNPIVRLKARDLYCKFCDKIADSQPLSWLVTIDVVFRYPNGMEQRETRELEARCRLLQLNSHCLIAINDAMKYGEGYSHTEFKVHCQGF